MTHSYKFFNYQLETDLVFPELTQIESAGEIIRVRKGRPGDAEYETVHQWMADGSVEIDCQCAGDVIRLEFPGMLVAYIDTGCTLILYEPAAAVPEYSIRHLLLDQVLPRLVSALGNLVVHASCVTMGSRTIAFTGKTGSGKSTFAASLVKDGWSVLSDDCLLLRVGNNVEVQGSYPCLRLDPVVAESVLQSRRTHSMVSHYTSKQRIELNDSVFGEPQRLDMVVCLKESASITMRKLSGATAVLSLVSESFCLDPSDKQRAREQLKIISDMVDSGTPVFELSYPRDLSQMGEVKTELMNCFALVK